MGRRAFSSAWHGFAASAAALLCVCTPMHGHALQHARGARTTAILIYPARQSSSDLAISGMIAGLPEGAIGYVRYTDLSTLPKIGIDIPNDDNFREIQPGHNPHATGIYLDVLAHSLGALPSSDMIDATCSDEYRGHYPASYIAAHHPILVIAVNHRPVSEWAKAAHQRDPGPYFVTHENFLPSFKVLSHADRPQVPSGVVRLNFTTIAATYGSIAPRGHFAPESMEEHGFIIARQNCFRCHNQGKYGGTKAGRTWMTLSTWAREQPAYFENYVSNPKAFELQAKMPGNPDYDKSTLDALAAYFRTFTAEPARENGSLGH